MSIEVLSRPAQPTLTTIPEPLERHLVAQGLRPSWTRKDSENLSGLYGRGVRAVRIADLPEEVQAELKQWPIFETPEGYLQRHDAVLVAQSQELYDQEQAVFDRVRKNREDPADELGDLEEKLKRLLRDEVGHTQKGHVLEGTVPRASDVVTVDKSPKAPGVRVGRG